MKTLIIKLTILLIATTLSPSLMAIDYVVSGAGTSVVNGTYLEDIVVNGKTSYKYEGAPTYYLFYKDSYWYIHDDTSPSGPTDSFYYIESSADEPPSSGWSTGSAGVEPFPTIAESQTYCLEFDGSDDYVDLGTSSDLKPTAALTVEVWANADNWQSASTGKFVSNTHVGGYGLSVRSTGIKFTVYSDGDYQQPSFSNSGYSGWHHIAGTFDGQYAKLYIDGILKNTVDMGTSGNAITYGYPNNSTLLGAEAGSSSTPDGSYFDGKFDDVRIWDVARTQAEIQEYICEDVSSESNLIAYYRMSNGSGTSLIDNSSTSYTGTLHNMDNSDWVTDYLIPTGDGTSGTEYQIQTLNHLWWLSQNSGEWSKLFEQTADIDMTVTTNWDGGEGFTPIGDGTTEFTGNYDGQNHTINRLYINRSGTDYIGLFGHVYNSANISNIAVLNVNFTGNEQIGGLIGATITSCIVSNCYSKGSLTGTGGVIGGLIGYNENSTVNNCYSTVTVSGEYYIGGLVGYNDNESEINNCYSTGSVSGDDDIGGLVGYNEASTVNNSFWNSSTSGQSSSAGGTGKTTAEMKNVATFTDVSTVGLTTAWDFTGNPYDDSGTDDYWSIDGSNNSGYPWFTWEGYDPVSITWQGDDITSPTDWNTAANWSLDAVPTVSNNPIINSGGNPVISATGTASCNNLTVNSGATLTINSTSSGTGSLIVKGTASGNVTVKRFLTHDRWHYIAGQTNISGYFSTLNMVLSSANSDQFYRWDESLVDGEDIGFWVDILNGPDGNSSTMGSESFVSCKGYAINYTGTDETLSLSGVPYTSNQSINITKTDGSTNEGANLVGNPFSSTIAANNDAASFLSINSSILDATNNAIYLWDEQVSYVGSRNDYTTISNSGDDAFIAVGQAFMVIKRDFGETALAFNTNMREHGTAPFYKNTNQDDVTRFYMSAENEEGLHNEILIAFIDGMTNGLDISYDAGKLKGNPDIALYTKLVDDNGADFAHQALPPLDGTTVAVKTCLDVSNAGNYTFKIVDLQNFNESISIKLKDKLTGSLIDFRQDGEYSFFVNSPGEIRNRFVLHFNGVTGIDDDVYKQNTIQTYASNNTLYILNPQQKQGTITIYNLTGQKVAAFELTGDTKQQQTLNVVDIINIVKIQTNDEVTSGKVIFR